MNGDKDHFLREVCLDDDSHGRFTIDGAVYPPTAIVLQRDGLRLSHDAENLGWADVMRFHPAVAMFCEPVETLSDEHLDPSKGLLRAHGDSLGRLGIISSLRAARP